MLVQGGSAYQRAGLRVTSRAYRLHATTAAAAAMTGGGRSNSPAGSRPTSPQLCAMNWRNPTVFLSQASVSGARGFMQMVKMKMGRTDMQRLHAHGDDSAAADEDEEREAALAGGSLTPSPPQPAAWGLVVALAAVSVAICYADRSNISTAIIPMAEQFQWDTRWQGIILSMFFLGYLATQLLGGALADRYGGKRVLAVGVAAWSVCTCLTPLAAMLGIPALIGMRIAMGVGEGVAFPAIHAIIARSVPVDKQSTAVGIVTAASYGGTALAFGLAPTIIDELGWPWVFYLFGASAVLWLPFWLPQRIEGGRSSGGGGKPFNLLDLFSSNGDVAAASSSGVDAAGRGPRGAPGSLPVSPSVDSMLERPQRTLSYDDALSEAGTEWSDGVAVAYKAQQQRQHGVGFAALIKTPEVWAICAAQYTGSWGFYGLLNWLPSFFKDHYHVEISQLASFTLLPYLVQGGVGAASGVLADKLLSRGWPVKRVRRVMQTAGMVGPAVCMLAAASPLTDGSPSAASAWITVGLGLNALTLGGVSVSHLDIAPKHAGVVFAAGNTSATIAGLLAVPLTGFVLQATDSWPLVFAITAAHYVAGAALFSLWVGDRPLPQDG